jgi:hypothetical protein
MKTEININDNNCCKIVLEDGGTVDVLANQQISIRDGKTYIDGIPLNDYVKTKKINKKYKLTDETIEYDGVTLYRIEALRDFGDVNAGDKGGFVQSELNLSQEGNCWIYSKAMVYDEAMIFGNAKVYGKAVVSGNAKVYDEAIICGNAVVNGVAKVYGEVIMRTDCRIY